MPKKRISLGRGLSALLGEPPADSPYLSAQPLEPSGTAGEEPGDTAAQETDRAAGARAHPSPGAEIVDVPVQAIRPNPRQPRRTMDLEGLEELASSIRTTGIVQPIIVRPGPDGAFELIAGERRWRAAQMAGYTAVPAIVREAGDVESLEISLIENVVRQQLNPVDEAFALHVLLEDLGVTQEALAERIGKSRSALANKVRLLELPPVVQEYLIEGRLSEGHGRALLGAKGRGDIVRLARRAVEQGLSVRAVEAGVKKLGDREDRAEAGPSGLPPQLLAETKERFWSTLEVMPRVRLQGQGESGRVELPFKDLAELRRVLDKLAQM